MLMRLGVGAAAVAGGAGMGTDFPLGSREPFKAIGLPATPLDTRRDCRNASAPDPTQAQIDRFRASASFESYHRLISKYLYR